MSLKMDRQGVRTPAELERKYNFEKRFDDAMGAVATLDKQLNQDEVFNRLTNNGKSQGVYKGDDGNIYINASYLVTGILKSQDGSTFYLDLVNGILKGQFSEFSISGKTVDETISDAFDSQTQEEAFNKLTNDGSAKGIYYQDGELYINASYITGAAPVGILQSVYPVGAIYISTVATNPATLFGFGTWEQIKDKFLLASGDTYEAGTTGGEATHTLTVNEIPSHNHIERIAVSGVGVNVCITGLGDDQNAGSSYVLSGEQRTARTYQSTDVSGGSQAHNNMPPYLTVYVWKRTA